jgi:hypothetical protein
MKKLIYLLCLSITLFSTSLMGQNSPASVHNKNLFPIGSPTDPVTANEYCNEFLREKISKVRDSWLNWLFEPYYDSTFMIAVKTPGNRSSKACIELTYSHNYVVRPGHGSDIIEALSSPVVQQEFNSWREEKLQERVAEEANQEEQQQTE